MMTGLRDECAHAAVHRAGLKPAPTILADFSCSGVATAMKVGVKVAASDAVISPRKRARDEGN